MPKCVEGESYREKLKITAYPAIEGGGLVWFYMGPPEKKPPYPGFEWFSLPTSHTHVAKYIYHSNYMQAIEGDFDPSHGAFLHATLNDNRDNPANNFRRHRPGRERSSLLSPEATSPRARPRRAWLS
jgi:phenylpropionate dioxygenase-like ring-hydroxylating dioxygenase large terminal subunit